MHGHVMGRHLRNWNTLHSLPCADFVYSFARLNAFDRLPSSLATLSPLQPSLAGDCSYTMIVVSK
jgi:hypothetical protein